MGFQVLLTAVGAIGFWGVFGDVELAGLPVDVTGAARAAAV